MKRIILILFFIPFYVMPQNDTLRDVKGKISSINQKGITSLIKKYEKNLKNKQGIEGWRLQIKFTSKREDILPYKLKFINLYPDITAQITFESPYYKLTVGNFRDKNDALRIKQKIRENFPGAHPISAIIDPNLFKK